MEFLEDIWFAILDFFDDHRKGLIITGIFIVVFIILSVVAYIIIDPIKIAWVGEDTVMIATSASSVNYTAVAYNRKGQGYPIEYQVTGGSVSVDDEGNAIWQLPVEKGTYFITATSDKATTTKQITVLGNNLISDLALEVEEVLMKDRDNDGLPDDYETSVSHTDPNKADTDGDNVTDGNEILLGLNPLEASSKNDGILDDQREVECIVYDQAIGVSVDIKGKKDITRTTLETFKTETLANVSAIVTDLIYIHSYGDVTSATISIVYDESKLSSLGIDPNNLAIYELNQLNNSFERLETTIDTTNKLVQTEVSTLGNYFVADKSKLRPSLSTELAFVIDNSGSMYSKEEISDSEENDVDFQRVDLSNKLIDRLNGNYKFSAGKFTFEYTNLADMTENKEEVKNMISSIKTSIESFTGTYIGNAIANALNQFNDEESINRRYMLLLTDGRDTTGVTGYNGEVLEKALVEAQEKNVKIYTIGLGQSIDATALKRISDTTGGKYYFASTADDLENIFNLVAAELNYNLLDVDNNNVDDHILICDSGATTKRDGISFSNFPNSTNQYGSTYGMALLSKLYYQKALDSNYKAITIRDGDVVIEAKEVAPSSAGLDYNLNSLYKSSPEVFGLLADLPKNFWKTKVENKVLGIQDEYKTELAALLLNVYSQDYVDENTDFNKYENYMLDINTLYAEDLNMDLYKVDTIDINFLRLIYRLDVFKYRDEEFKFIDDSDKAYNKLVEELSNGRPTLLKLNENYTVLALKLMANLENPNKLKIEIYDPNYSGQIRYLDVERTQNIQLENYNESLTRYEYKFTYQGIKTNVSVSIPNLASNL